MTFSKVRTWPSVVALGFCVVAACGGTTNKPGSSNQGGAAGGATGAEWGSGDSGSGESGPGGSPTSRAGSASTGGHAGSAGASGNGGVPTECEAGSPATCDEGDLVECDPSGLVTRTDCGAYSECSLEGGAHCELSDLPLAMEENEFGFAWRDAFMLLPCYEVQAHDCLTVPSGQTCPNQETTNWEEKGLVLTETFQIGGEVGKVYQAHLIVNGIVAGKYYQGGVRDRGNDFSNLNQPEGSDAFHRNGNPIQSSYDTWEVTVRHGTGEVFGHYYLNSYPQHSGLESHQTVPLGYEKDIEVPGGGTVEYRVHDSNCRAIDNCGPGDGICFARNVPNEPGLSLPETWQGKPLASYNVVSGGQQPFHAQLVHLRVSKITYLKDIEPVLP